MESSTTIPRLSLRQKAVIWFLKYGYANRIPGSWVNAVLLGNPEDRKLPRDTYWNAIGERARQRLIANGLGDSFRNCSEYEQNSADNRERQADPSNSLP